MHTIATVILIPSHHVYAFEARELLGAILRAKGNVLLGPAMLEGMAS